ncbi:hypothetical protein IEQ34_005732 [Dendrobium chrysotoxum]|uniref:Uncharacterized protein n=1 Tax=Dendrobium chrysotoxum TaxID=161865 RepID=A0AAV7GVW3_DENCH|nr:hypothetical protein IEQ34_005732 [Dendrobium chrysotoxum]
MASRGDEPPKQSITNIFRSKNNISGRSGRGRGTEGTSSSQPSIHTQLCPPFPTPLVGSPQFYSTDPAFYHQTYADDSLLSILCHTIFSGSHYYLSLPTIHFTILLPTTPSPSIPGPSTPTTVGLSMQTTVAPTTDRRMLIQPKGDVYFCPSKQPTNKIRDIIQSRFDAPYVSWKKILKKVCDMWFREFEMQETFLRLAQWSKIVIKYEIDFTLLARYALQLVRTLKKKCYKFLRWF